MKPTATAAYGWGMQPRPPLYQRLPARQRLGLDVAAATGYGLVAWAVFAHKIALPLGLSGTALAALSLGLCRRRPLPAFAAGYVRGTQRRYGDELVRHHAGLAEAERERARRGAAEERIRIARELHDVVAHGMSVITVQAGFGHLVIDEKPADARTALAAIEAIGRQTLDEMRQLLDVLRADGTPAFDPAPGLGGLDQLVSQAAQAGIRVDLAITGSPRDLPAGIELSAYRILQEALTNVAKHAGPCTVRAVISYLPRELAIEVTDDGRGGPVSKGGLGLAGMRERAHIYGGELAAGPLSARGFRVTARLPLPATAQAMA
jgi:signal transduction histidine kinase